MAETEDISDVLHKVIKGLNFPPSGSASDADRPMDGEYFGPDIARSLPRSSHVRYEKTILLCMGTRPEIIKMAPIYHALRDTPLRPVILHTGQHKEMVWPIYEFFGIKPDIVLNVSRERDSLAHLSAQLVDELDRVLENLAVDAVLVQGDTSSALMAALAAFYRKVPVGHIEAGLRSHIGFDPFPEEKNRALISRIATWHFAPTVGAVRNLVSEGLPIANVFCVGNTVIDATEWGLSKIVPHFNSLSLREAWRFSKILELFQTKKLVVVTAHRRENWNGPIERIAKTMREIVERNEQLLIVWPLHPNPVVKDVVHAAMANLGDGVRERIVLTEPLNYPRMLWLLRHAWLVLTDSGGIQEEAAAIKVPVLVLRNTTERPELIDAGGGALIGTDGETIRSWIHKLLHDTERHDSMRKIENPFGDGRASEYVAGILYQELLASNPTALGHAA